MNLTAQTKVIDGVTFELEPFKKKPIRKQRVCLRKNNYIVDRYLTLASEFHECKMVEIGVDRGGGTAFFCKSLNPEKLVAIELSDEPVNQLLAFLAEHDPEGKIQIHWGVDQSDRSAVPAILDQSFGEQDLDLVVDDASHLLAPSTASFEMLFPRLRKGGLYVLEDWSGFHSYERDFAAALESRPEAAAVQDFVAAVDAMLKEGGQPDPPMSILICQLVVACGFHPDWISDIKIVDGYCEVRRGPGEIPPGTPLSEYTGKLGAWIFENRLP